MGTKAKKNKIKSGGRKSPLLIVQKKNIKGRFYHVNTKTGKKASADEYRLQWINGKRTKNKVVQDTINVSKKYIEEDEKIDWETLRAVQQDILKTEEAKELRKTDISFRKKADSMIYYEVRNLLKTVIDGSPDTKIKILRPDGQRYVTYTPAQAMEIIDNFIHKLNKKTGELRKKKINLSPLPQIAFKHDIEKNTIQFDLKNLIGEEERKEVLEILERELKTKK